MSLKQKQNTHKSILQFQNMLVGNVSMWTELWTGSKTLLSKHLNLSESPPVIFQWYSKRFIEVVNASLRKILQRFYLTSRRSTSPTVQ